LYDLTSTYFEGKCLRNPQAKRGYSRDKRPDCKQVVIGLVIDRDGFPKAHEVFDGNTVDTKTVEEMLDVLEKRVGRKTDGTVVVDRGMAYKDNIESIKGRGYHYIVACRQSERDQHWDEFVQEGGWKEIVREVSATNPSQKKPKVCVRQQRVGEETHVLCISDGRKEKDRAIREKQEQRLLKDLAKLQTRCGKGGMTASQVHEAIGRIKERYPRVARYYEMQYDTATHAFSWSEITEKKAKDVKLDGAYLLKTDRQDLTDEEIWRTYILLTRVENAFRNMKSPLAERPIFHHKTDRVQAHIFLCVLAYHLLVAIEKRFLDCHQHTSWATLRQQLSTHQVATVHLPASNGEVLSIRRAAIPEEIHREIYKVLAIPEEIMKPVKTWYAHSH
jgi:transposase